MPNSLHLCFLTVFSLSPANDEKMRKKMELYCLLHLSESSHCDVTKGTATLLTLSWLMTTPLETESGLTIALFLFYYLPNLWEVQNEVSV